MVIAGTFGFGGDPDNRALEVSDDGKTFSKVIDIPKGGVDQRTLSFNPVTARYFRFTWKTPEPQPPVNIGAMFGFGEGYRMRPKATLRSKNCRTCSLQGATSEPL